MRVSSDRHTPRQQTHAGGDREVRLQKMRDNSREKRLGENSIRLYKGKIKNGMYQCYTSCNKMHTDFFLFSIQYSLTKRRRIFRKVNSREWDGCRYCLGENYSHSLFGKNTVIFVPSPTRLVRSICPPRYCTACFTIESPSPVPPVAFEWLLSTR